MNCLKISAMGLLKSRLSVETKGECLNEMYLLQ